MYKMDWREIPLQDKAKAMAWALEDFCNFSTRMDNKAVADNLSSIHPSLQQYIFDLFIQYVENLSSKERYDVRNEQAVKSSKKIIEII
tara:strand:- start:3979 stop:4242 length:264 start_codon:yes stop_codon:yes gene_type:complete